MAGWLYCHNKSQCHNILSYADIMTPAKNRHDMVSCAGGYASVMLPYRKRHCSGRRDIPYGSAEKPLRRRRTVCFAARNGVSCAEKQLFRVVKDAFPRPKRLFRIVSYGIFDAHLWSVCRNRMILYVLRLHTKRHAVCMPSPCRLQGRELWRHTEKHCVSRMPHSHYIMTVMGNAAIHMLANQSRDARFCVSRASMCC